MKLRHKTGCTSVSFMKHLGGPPFFWKMNQTIGALRKEGNITWEYRGWHGVCTKDSVSTVGQLYPAISKKEKWEELL